MKTSVPHRHLVLVGVIAAATALSGARGTLRFPDIERRHDVVVLVADARSGKMLGGIRTEEAFVQRYHPASIFKLAIAVAALGSGRESPSFSYTCTGRDTIAGAAHECWLPKGHGTLRLADALAGSCNLYFRHVATRLSEDDLRHAAGLLGMVSPSGFPGSSEQTASPRFDDVNILGEAFHTSPAQMLRVALALASRGRLASTSLTSARYGPIYEGMKKCISTGTGKDAWTRRFTLAGKTGTAGVEGMPNQTVGWFLGFAPARHPQYAVVVLYRYGRGMNAAAIARDVLERIM